MKKNLSLKTLMKEVSRWFMKDDQTWIFSSFINKGSVDCVTLLLRDIATPKVKTRFLLFSLILHNKTISKHTLHFEAVQARNSAWIIFIQYIHCIPVMTCSAIVNKLALPKVDITYVIHLHSPSI